MAVPTSWEKSTAHTVTSVRAAAPCPTTQASSALACSEFVALDTLAALLVLLGTGRRLVHKPRGNNALLPLHHGKDEHVLGANVVGYMKLANLRKAASSRSDVSSCLHASTALAALAMSASIITALPTDRQTHRCACPL